MKSIINEEPRGSGSSSYSTPFETYRLTQEIKFPMVVGEGFSTDYEVRDAPVLPVGTLPGITLTKIGSIVHLMIPSFHGTLLIGNATSLMRIVTTGDIPDRFLPNFRCSWPVDAYNNSGLINVNQDHADLEVDTSGNVDLSSKSFFWDGNAGLNHDVHVSWRV